MMLFLDIDGTILTSSQSIGSEDLQAIAQIKKENKIVLISARKPSATKFIAKQLKIRDDIIVCYNGALILLRDKVLFERMLSYKIIKEVCMVVDNYGVSANIYCGDKWLTTKVDKYVNAEAEIVGEFPQLILDIPKDISAHKILIICNDEQASSIMHSLRFIDGIVSSQSKKGYIEISDNKISKGSAFYQVLGYEGVPVSATMAIGDGSNDIMLLKNAAIGIAMQNSTDEVKMAANFVTLSNDNNGVAFAIKHYIKCFSRNE